MCLFRDHLYRLTLTSLTDLEHASWYAPEDKVNTCQTKGQSVEDCHNYVKVLLSNGKSLFTCGTYAFSPWCAWREVRLNGTGRGGQNEGEEVGWSDRPVIHRMDRDLCCFFREPCVCVCVSTRIDDRVTSLAAVKHAERTVAVMIICDNNNNNSQL